MRHRIRPIVVYLLLGGVTTVAVAWACALRSSIPNTGGRVLENDSNDPAKRLEWPVNIELPWLDHPESIWQPEGRGISVIWAGARGPVPSEWGVRQTRYKAALFLAGWPLRSMRWHLTSRTEDAMGNLFAAFDESRNVWDGGIEVPIRLVNKDNDFVHLRRLPIRPCPLGFAADTVFYGAVWYMVGFGWAATRRGIRRRRGWCINCGYDLTGNEWSVCPECAQPVAPGDTMSPRFDSVCLRFRTKRRSCSPSDERANPDTISPVAASRGDRLDYSGDCVE